MSLPAPISLRLAQRVPSFASLEHDLVVSPCCLCGFSRNGKSPTSRMAGKGETEESPLSLCKGMLDIARHIQVAKRKEM